jgi:hypothetical protein
MAGGMSGSVREGCARLPAGQEPVDERHLLLVGGYLPGGLLGCPGATGVQLKAPLPEGRGFLTLQG